MQDLKQSTPIIQKLLMTVEEAAQTLSLGRSSVYALIMRKQIHTVKVGRRRLVPVESLRKYVNDLQACQ